MTVFQKPAITPAQQIELLKNRGLTIIDEQRALCFLEVVSFFRLTPYMRPFQHNNDAHQFKESAKNFRGHPLESRCEQPQLIYLNGAASWQFAYCIIT